MSPRIVAFLLVASAPASAQLASSPGYQLDAAQLDGGGSALCSAGFVTVVDQNEIGADAALTSTGFQAEIGVLTLHDPFATSDPVVFGVSPDLGPVAGGTPFTLCGRNFVAQGAAGAVAVDVGGAAALGVTVVSDTTVTATTPVGTSGPAEVAVTTSLAATTREDAFLYTPALRTSPYVYAGGVLTITNIGPVGQLFRVAYSPNQTSVPTAFGLLLIGPSPITVAYDAMYPAPDGVHVVQVPIGPGLEGLTLYTQSGLVFSLGPLTGQLLNATAVEFK